MNPIQPGMRTSPESRPTPPSGKEKIVKEGEAPQPVQPQEQIMPPQAPARRVEPVQIQPEAPPQVVTPAQTQEPQPLNPEEAQERVAQLVASEPQTANDLSNLAEQLDKTTSRT